MGNINWNPGASPIFNTFVAPAINSIVPGSSALAVGAGTLANQIANNGYNTPSATPAPTPSTPPPNPTPATVKPPATFGSIGGVPILLILLIAVFLFFVLR